MCISKITLSSGNLILSFSDGIVGLSLSNASESACFCSGAENSCLFTSVGLGLFVLSSGQIVGSNSSLMFSNLTVEGSIELSLSTGSSHSYFHCTEVFMGLLGSFVIKSLLFGDVSVSGGLSFIKGINVIKERKTSKVGSFMFFGLFVPSSMVRFSFLRLFVDLSRDSSRVGALSPLR
jgi:hypothetical protein